MHLLKVKPFMLFMTLYLNLITSENRLFAFGPEVGDTLVETRSDISQERLSTPTVVKSGLPLNKGVIVNALYVSS